MTKDDRRLVDQAIGYIRAKKESGKNETFLAEQIIAISQALFICEKELCPLEYHVAVQGGMADAVRGTIRKYIEKNRKLEERLRKKTYPIDRAYAKEKRLLLEIAKLNELLTAADEENESFQNEIGLQAIEIKKLGGLLKEADDRIFELEGTLERVRMEVVTQTARDNEEKIKGGSNE